MDNKELNEICKSLSWAEQMEIYEVLGITPPDNIRNVKEWKSSNFNMAIIVRCKDCIHKPYINGEFENGFSIEFPDNLCPCQCDDGWYNWMPDDDWYCANGE